MKLLEKILAASDTNIDSTQQINAFIKLAAAYKSLYYKTMAKQINSKQWDRKI